MAKYFFYKDFKLLERLQLQRDNLIFLVILFCLAAIVQAQEGKGSGTFCKPLKR